VTPEVANHPRDLDVLGRPKPCPRHEFLRARRYRSSLPLSRGGSRAAISQPRTGHRVARYRRVAVTISVEGNAHKGKFSNAGNLQASLAASRIRRSMATPLGVSLHPGGRCADADGPRQQAAQRP
jgi:hypothetical protein